MSLENGLEALEQGRYAEAVELLEQFCQSCTGYQSVEYLQSRISLARAYYGVGERDKLVEICQELATNDNPNVSSWAGQWLYSIVSAPKYTQDQLEKILEQGKEALRVKNYPEAIRLIEEYCHNTSDWEAIEYQQAQMLLLQAYKGNRQLDEAISLCRDLRDSEDTMVREWVKQTLPSLHTAKSQQNQRGFTEQDTFLEISAGSFDTDQETDQSIPTNNQTPKKVAIDKKTLDQETTSKELTSKAFTSKAPRGVQEGIRLPLTAIAGNLTLASTFTISVLLGMVLVLSLSLLLIVNSENPGLGLLISVIITVVFNTITFFIAPLIMDLTQQWLYSTNWVELAEIERYSPESAEVINRVCQQKNLRQPRLGIIEDQNPTAFTYGSLPNNARLVVSRGLFTYLDDEEIATVYAHELGHIVHWDFAVMTLAATLVQITYLIYTFARNINKGDDNNQIKDKPPIVAIAAYIFYIAGTYLTLYLSRIREYYADHFATEITGNPNGLSRALVKIAYGIVQEKNKSQQEKSQESSKLMEGTRALGIYDHRVAPSTGTAYEISRKSEQNIGQVFLWDMFNPWAWWIELNSTHPLTGKRIRALTNYAEQMDLETEFNFGEIIREGNNLSKGKLYKNFIFDLVLFNAPLIGITLGLIVAIGLYSTSGSVKELILLPLLGFGLGTLLKTLVMYPDFRNSQPSDIFTLMCDPYASPLRGQPVQLEGELIGRGDAGYQFGADLQLKDDTGMIFSRYSSRFGDIGNFLFGLAKVKELIGSQVNVSGWFRRSIAPWIDLKEINSSSQKVRSYPRFWDLVLGCGSMILAGVLLSL